MKSFELYPWQRDCLEQINGRDNVIISAPTGAGKSLMAYLWADVFMPTWRIIFTAPIKALSNERYIDLKKNGVHDVGIETGDIKRNTDATILCCTQEIYTRKYAKLPNQIVIIDEFHYITQDPQRARAYIDGIVNTHNTTKILVMSATFGDCENVKKYLDKISGRNFYIYETQYRATKLVYLDKPIKDSHDIRNALVFAFSRKGICSLAQYIANIRPNISKGKISKIESIAQKLDIRSDIILNFAKKGLGIYVGSMLPKEKVFTEICFRERYIDSVFGTDALAIGVNMPAQTVVFAQLAKYHDGVISKNMFLQMAGRAGRKGYWDVGYVTCLENSWVESANYNTFSLYKSLVSAPQEPFAVSLSLSIENLLHGISPEAEAYYIAQHSWPEKAIEPILIEARNICSMIEKLEHQYKGIKDILKDIYFNELSFDANIEIALLFRRNYMVHANDILQIIMLMGENRGQFYALLQTLRLLNSLPKHMKGRIIGYKEIEGMINEMDKTVLNFENYIM